MYRKNKSAEPRLTQAYQYSQDIRNKQICLEQMVKCLKNSLKNSPLTCHLLAASSFASLALLLCLTALDRARLLEALLPRFFVKPKAMKPSQRHKPLSEKQ